MANESETVLEVCAEMRYDIVHESEWYVSRILAAHEREMSAKDAEIARLMAALKPVLGVCITQDDLSLDIYDSTMDGIKSVNAVREAKRIHKEGCAE